MEKVQVGGAETCMACVPFETPIERSELQIPPIPALHIRLKTMDKKL
jgi:hypothetical protein